ncbi:MAG: hypothetical protein RL077_3305 [Verrucomicrobiota bacterium]
MLGLGGGGEVEGGQPELARGGGAGASEAQGARLRPALRPLLEQGDKVVAGVGAEFVRVGEGAADASAPKVGTRRRMRATCWPAFRRPSASPRWSAAASSRRPNSSSSVMPCAIMSRPPMSTVFKRRASLGP